MHAIGAGARAGGALRLHRIEHGTFLTDEVLDLMAQRGALRSEHLELYNYLDKSRFLGRISPQTLIAEMGIAPMAEALRRARAKKVKIVFGTDAVAGSPAATRRVRVPRE